jgi:molybdopterin-biosynthesis enzyme MoeA-like protein
MSYLPINSNLLKNNPINKMCGYYLDERFFFVPGFPEMARPMILEALDKFYPYIEQIERFTLIANVKEGEIVDIMQSLPDGIDFSSLPMVNGSVEISMKSKEWFEFFKEELENRGISFN